MGTKNPEALRHPGFSGCHPNWHDNMVAGVGRVLLPQSADFERLPPLSSARGKQSAGLFASRSRLLKVQVPSIKKRTTKRLFSFLW